MICQRCKGAGWIQRIGWSGACLPSPDFPNGLMIGSGSVEKCPDCQGHGEVSPPPVKEQGRFVCEVRGKPLGRLMKELELAIGGTIPRLHLQELARMIARMRCGEPAEVAQRWRDWL